jgi:hypothetical protein
MYLMVHPRLMHINVCLEEGFVVLVVRLMDELPGCLNKLSYRERQARPPPSPKPLQVVLS